MDTVDAVDTLDITSLGPDDHQFGLGIGISGLPFTGISPEWWDEIVWRDGTVTPYAIIIQKDTYPNMIHICLSICQILLILTLFFTVNGKICALWRSNDICMKPMQRDSTRRASL
jgi:hypothetical protein